jgi:hypothetical protein
VINVEGNSFIFCSRASIANHVISLPQYRICLLVFLLAFFTLTVQSIKFAFILVKLITVFNDATLRAAFFQQGGH